MNAIAGGSALGLNVPERILIIRLSAIGDIVMASALIPALREAWPHAYLAWLSDEGNRDLLRHNPRLDRLFLWPRARWRKLAQKRRYGELGREAWGLIKELREERFDLVLDAQGLLKSGIWTWLSGGKERIGLGSKEGSQYLMTQVLDRKTGNKRIGSEYLKLARHLGIEPGNFAMDIVVGEEDAQEAKALLRRRGVGGPYAVLCPFTTRPQKHWFNDRWSELARALASKYGLTPVVLGGPSARAQAEIIQQGAGPCLIDLTGQTTLGQCGELIRGAALVVGVDTGLTHLGVGLQVPTLALFGATRPYLDTATARARVLYEAWPCSPCRRRPTCQGLFPCMRAHDVDKVLTHIERLLSE